MPTTLVKESVAVNQTFLCVMCIRSDCVRRPDKCLSNGKRNERNTYLYSIVAFQFRKPVKAAHIKVALFNSMVSIALVAELKMIKSFSICKTKEVK